MMNKGSLIYEDYCKLINNNILLSKNFNKNQIQPSSIDLTLSEECYEIRSSFLSHTTKVRDKLTKFAKKKINLDKGLILKKNITYLIRLNEKLNLPKNIFGKCNPKSSTGRLDIFCRTILDYTDEYEKIPYEYNGEIFLEITSRAFKIFIRSGESLNQMRLINVSNNLLDDYQLYQFHKIKPIVFDNEKNNIHPVISSGLKIAVDLNSNNKVTAYKAKENAPVLYFHKNKHKVSDFWESIKSNDNSLTIFPGEFFILKSKQKIRIPKNMAGEMIPYDATIGDFRVHYAGFFDPGFGDPYGSFAVLEVRTNEVPFNLEDGQTVARLIYENLNKTPNITYGTAINSNYQNQGLALSKHFNIRDK